MILYAKGASASIISLIKPTSSSNVYTGRWFRHTDARHVILVLLERSHKLCMRWICCSWRRAYHYVAMLVRSVRIDCCATRVLIARIFARSKLCFLQNINFPSYARKLLHVDNDIIVAFPYHGTRCWGWGWGRRSWRVRSIIPHDPRLIADDLLPVQRSMPRPLRVSCVGLSL